MRIAQTIFPVEISASDEYFRLDVNIDQDGNIEMGNVAISGTNLNQMLLDILNDKDLLNGKDLQISTNRHGTIPHYVFIDTAAIQELKCIVDVIYINVDEALQSLPAKIRFMLHQQVGGNLVGYHVFNRKDHIGQKLFTENPEFFKCFCQAKQNAPSNHVEYYAFCQAAVQTKTKIMNEDYFGFETFRDFLFWLLDRVVQTTPYIGICGYCGSYFKRKSTQKYCCKQCKTNATNAAYMCGDKTLHKKYNAVYMCFRRLKAAPNDYVWQGDAGEFFSFKRNEYLTKAKRTALLHTFLDSNQEKRDAFRCASSAHAKGEIPKKDLKKVRDEYFSFLERIQSQLALCKEITSYEQVSDFWTDD